MKTFAMLVLCLLSTVNAQAGTPGLSKACKKILNHSKHLAYEQQKIAIQFGSDGNLREADSIVRDAIDTCVEMALDGKNYSDEKKTEVSRNVSVMAERYLQDES